MPGHLAVVPGQRRHLLRVVGTNTGPHSVRLGRLLVELEHELARAPSRPRPRDAVLVADARAARRPACRASTAHAGLLLDQLGHRGPPPRRREVELPAARRSSVVRARTARSARWATSSSVSAIMSVVVGVGLVELEHRELGVVPGEMPSLRNTRADLEHPLEAADDQPLQVQLGRDAQVEVDVERVVVGDERLGQRAAGDRVEAPASRPRRSRGPRASGG